MPFIATGLTVVTVVYSAKHHNLDGIDQNDAACKNGLNSGRHLYDPLDTNLHRPGAEKGDMPPLSIRCDA
ncbi:hypothetical protein LDENG_00028490 [Lucifuga dentata]|nr:hypothetical protein LDENG_00028490 [Lucifuga dentata]